MANKRMFSKIITNSDPFLEMPVSSQNLYFHLGMNADDDGFVQVKSVMKQLGSGDDDLKVLLTKGFLIRFADGVIVITAWKVNNEIRGDRYKPTYYQEHLEKLQIESNRCYSLIPERISVNSMVVPNDNQMTTRCLPDGDTDQVSIGKVSIDQVSIGDAAKLKRFTPPTHYEIAEYCNNTQYNIDIDSFIDFYTSKGWKVGNNQMKDWQAAVRNWHRRDKNKPQTQPKKSLEETYNEFEELVNELR